MTDKFSSNQIECTRCGASVYYELTRCPECGLNFYPVDERDRSGLDIRTKEGPLIPGVYPVAVIAGWMAFALVAFLVHFVAGALSKGQLGVATNLILLFFDFVSALGAGYLTAFLADENQIPHGFVVSILGIGTRILFDAYWRDLASESVVTTWSLLSWLLILLGAGLGALWMRNRSLRVDHILFPEADSLYLNLMSKVNYDQDTVERLIDFERQRLPNGNKARWIKNALARWERDNRI